LIRGLRKNNLKIAFAPFEKNAPLEYYNLEKDPQEKQNLSSVRKSNADALYQEAERIAAAFHSGGRVGLSEKEKAAVEDKLKSLGYM
jgi:hypothetical protein